MPKQCHFNCKFADVHPKIKAQLISDCSVCIIEKPWHGDIAHTTLSDGRKVLRGSVEEWVEINE